MIAGREMGDTSHQVKNNFNKLKTKDKVGTRVKCKSKGCKSGFKHNVLTDEISQCEVCLGYGYLREN
jgi:hypothetical protein